MTTDIHSLQHTSLLEVAERELANLHQKREQLGVKLKELEGQVKAARLDMVWTVDGISRLEEEIEIFTEAHRIAKTGRHL